MIQSPVPSTIEAQPHHITFLTTKTAVRKNQENNGQTGSRAWPYIDDGRHPPLWHSKQYHTAEPRHTLSGMFSTAPRGATINCVYFPTWRR